MIIIDKKKICTLNLNVHFIDVFDYIWFLFLCFQHISVKHTVKILPQIQLWYTTSLHRNKNQWHFDAYILLCRPLFCSILCIGDVKCHFQTMSCILLSWKLELQSLFHIKYSYFQNLNLKNSTNMSRLIKVLGQYIYC